MGWKQTYTPNVRIRATRGWCLAYIDNAGNAPKRTPNARAAINVEAKAKRIRTDTPLKNIWVVGFLDLRRGAFAADDHVFFMKYLGGGKYEIRDSETQAGARSVYTNIGSILAWFGNYSPRYIGWSTDCDGRNYAKYTAPKPKKKPTPSKTSRKPAKGHAVVTVSELFVHDTPDAKSKRVGSYKKGQSFNYDSYIVTNGYVWLSYVSFSGKRRYVAEGPNDGKNNTVYVKGGV